MTWRFPILCDTTNKRQQGINIAESTFTFPECLFQMQLSFHMYFMFRFHNSPWVLLP